MSQSNAELERLSMELTTYTGRLVRAIARRGSSEVPAASLRLLSQLDERGPVSIGQLAQWDRCSQPTMSNAVGKLTARGWAVKVPHPSDARSSLVELTDDGRAVLGRARRRNAAVIAERLRADPDHDVADLAVAVSLIKGLLDEHPDETERIP
ncbi:MAG: MarR family winged helix-turn-helix transcriptional regulator [Oryzihumus sp.]